MREVTEHVANSIHNLLKDRAKEIEYIGGQGQTAEMKLNFMGFVQ